MITRRTLLRSCAAAASLSAASACALTRNRRGKHDMLSSITHQLVHAYPESASSAGIDHGKYQNLKSRLTDRSIDGQAEIENFVRTSLTQLRKVDADALPSDQALTLDVVRTVFESAANGFDFGFGDTALLNTNWSYRNAPYVVAQNTGAFVEIPQFLESAHSIKSTNDADAYIARISAYAQQIDGETDRVRIDSQKGIVMPNFLMAKTLKQLKGQLAIDVSEWGLVYTLASQTQHLDGRYADQVTRVTQKEVVPALQRQIDALEAIAPRSTSNAGIWAIPKGDAYYAWALQAGTTTSMLPEEVHQMGLEELKMLHGEMDPILKDIGYTTGSVGERMAALAKDPRYQFSDGDKGRQEILAFIEEKLADIRERMPQAFNTLVPGYLEVTRIPEEVEKGAPSAYGGPGSIDGKQPGHFWINLRTPKLHSKYSLPDLTYHEAIPGHVWQGEYTFKQPLIRSLLAFNAYSEGWALYAEQLADELGVYDSFPVGRLGYLQSLAFRACRLVVDTGLHAKRWTREQAIDFFVQYNGSNPEEVDSEVDRYCAWPGQACGYKVGHTAIVQLRKKAQLELGATFDLRRFNDALVLGGSVPMTILEQVVNAFIAKARDS